MKKLIIAIILLMLVFGLFVVLDMTFKDRHNLSRVDTYNKYL